MKLRRTEKVAIAVTVLIFAMLAGYGYGSSQGGSGTFYVHTEREMTNPPLPTAAPAAETISPTTAGTLSPGALAGRVNINTATVAELQTLPGIGETIAERIIKYREEHGRFETADDIMNVQGIGEKTYEKLRELITVMEGEQ